MGRVSASIVGATLLCAVALTHAFEVVQTDKPNEYLKWGASKVGAQVVA